MPSGGLQQRIVQETLSEARKAARSLGCDEYEFFCSSVTEHSVLVECDRVVSASSIRDLGLFARIANGGRLGVAFTNGSDARRVRACVSAAVRLSRVADRDVKWRGFPHSRKSHQTIEGIFDRRVASMDLSELRSGADAMIQSARKDRKVSVTGGEVESAHKVLGISNSSGVDAEMEETLLSAECLCVCGTGVSVTPECMDTAVTRSRDLDFGLLGESASRFASLSSRAVAPKAGKFTVLFSPVSLGSSDSGLLNIVLSRALSGECFVRKTCFMADKTGDEIAGKALTVVDDPTMPGLVGSRPFDDEGMPCRKTSLIEKGVLKGFLWNSHYGAMAGRGSTGNGARDYSTGAVSIAPMNLVVRPGRGDLDSLAEKIDRGYLIWGCQGAHTANVETGDFSFVASPGLEINRGEIIGGVNGALVSGNVLDMLRGVEMVGSDQRDFGSCFMPSMVFRDVRITTG